MKGDLQDTWEHSFLFHNSINSDVMSIGRDKRTDYLVFYLMQSVARSSFKLWTISTVEKHEGADNKLIQGDSFLSEGVA